MKIWIAKKGDTKPSIITTGTCTRPDEMFVEAPDGDMNPDHYLVEWQGDTPVLISRPGWEDDDLRKTKDRAWERIKAERDRRMDGGFKVEVSAGVFKWYHSDPKSRVQHLGLMMAGAAIPPIPWKTLDGTFVPMTQAIITKVFQAALALDGALFTKAEQHKAAMEASPDPLSCDFSTGWPENFLGL